MPEPLLSISKNQEARLKGSLFSALSAKHYSQKVGLEHILKDKDILTIVTTR